ncbi:peptide ABC transporter substrate-binding protein [Clostridioides sp. ES-S-0190-01]|uniref:peptide ABC transporter substrate-binding protein n=1 Tax=Clostridioides sp. ES-S-0190-01 TaxID=2770787 RepID=UPI001D11C266|nr:peptide ABC transporter substrate-binding protein [Clostridioides sp. ES-S-0190-01]
MRYKKIITLLVVAILALNLVACSTPTQGDATKGSVFQGTQGKEMVTLNVTSEPTELNPMRMSDTIAQSILYHCMAGFTKLNEKDEPVADLAERWDINDANTIYTMHLRKDAKWSNGDPVTANDFYYSWVTQMTPSTGSIFASYIYKNIKNGEAFYKGEIDESQLGLKVLDDYTLEIQWSHPMTNGLFYLSQPYFLPINKKAYKAIGDKQYAKEADKMVTNGAYKITEWVHDDHITMEKAEEYYNASEINIPKVKLVMIGDADTSLNAFTAGEIDLCNLYNEQIKLVRDKSKDTIQSYIDGGSWYLSFNTQNEYLSNINLRKALAYSIDVQSLLNNVINDGSIAANGLVPGVIKGVDGKSYAEKRGSLFKYDKDKAREFLDKALQELGIEKKDIKLVFWTSDTTYNQNQAAYLQQQWKENLGLDVELKSTAVKALSEAKRNGDYSFAVDAWGPSENDAITFLENYTTENMNNYGKYSNPKYDKLIEDSTHESDSKKRQEILIQAEKILMDDMVIGPMYFTCTTYAVSDKLVGLVRTPFQFFNVLNAHIK